MARTTIACPRFREPALLTYEENRRYLVKCANKYCQTEINIMEPSLVSAIETINSMVCFPEPKKPLIWGDETHDTILCPNCHTDLMGGFPGDETGELEVFQCWHCGQPVNTYEQPEEYRR